MKRKLRLDQFVLQKYPDLSRNQIQSFIMQGKVKVDDKTITKSGTLVPIDAKIELFIEKPKYVCRAGWKLEKALHYFNIDVKNLVVLDAGLSTGGFTDCLLQRGAKKIFGIDVGYGQVHEKIRYDPKVVVMERINLRSVRDLGEKVDLVTLDLSFISILKVMDAVNAVLKENGKLITLIKPQFEATPKEVPKGGVIKDPQVHEKIIKRVVDRIKKYGFELKGVVESPILGAAGNKEFLAYFLRKS